MTLAVCLLLRCALTLHCPMFDFTFTSVSRSDHLRTTVYHHPLLVFLCPLSPSPVSDLDPPISKPRLTRYLSLYIIRCSNAVVFVRITHRPCLFLSRGASCGRGVNCRGQISHVCSISGPKPPTTRHVRPTAISDPHHWSAYLVAIWLESKPPRGKTIVLLIGFGSFPAPRWWLSP